MFIHLYKVLFQVLSFIHGWVIQIAQNLYTGEEGWGQSFLQVFTESSKLAFRAGFSRENGIGSLMWGMPGMFMASAFRMKRSPQKSMHRLVPLFHTPQSCELAISRTKRSGVKVIVASHIF